MIKKESMLLLALLVSLPGCMGRKKSDQGKKGRKMAQSANDLKNANTALAAGDQLDTIDPEMQSFFNDMEEFVSFADEGDIDLKGDAMKQDEFAWQDTSDQDKQLEVVYFGFNKDKVTPDEKAKVAYNIDKAKEILAESHDAKLVVEGHACASAGSDAYNMAISERRAKEVADQLVDAGVPREIVKTVGRGKEMLVVSEGDREAQSRNRRVELHVIHS